MRTIWILTKKNLRLLIRAKGSALIVFLAPLLLILLLGLVYNTTSQYGLNIGVYAPSFTEDAQSLVTLLAEQEFTISTYEDSIETCVDDIKLGIVHTCVSLPESLTVSGNTPQEVVYYVDPSNVNIVWMLQQTLQSKIMNKSLEISQGLGGNLLGILSSTKNILTEQQGVLTPASEKSSSASSVTASVVTNLDTIDLTEATYFYNGTLVTATGVEVRQAISDISAALTEISGSTLNTTAKNNITASLNAADADLDDALAMLNTSTENIQQIVTNLQTELSAATTRLANAATTISTASADLSGASTSLSEIATTIVNVHAGLGEAQALLAGQEVTDAGTLAAPLITRVEQVTPQATYLNYLFPALLVLVVMFSSLLLGTTLVMMEKNSPAFMRNFFVPIPKVTFIAAIYLTNLLLILIEVGIILLVSLFFMSDSIAVFPAMAIILFFAASVFTFLGMNLGYLFRSEETGILASISVGSMLLLISGVVLPVESMPMLFREIMAFNPFVITENLLREVFIFGTNFSVVLIDLLLLIAYTVVLFLSVIIIESTLHKQLPQRLVKYHQEHRRRRKRVTKKK
jgi:ABC-type multidrug transport system permease subunit